MFKELENSKKLPEFFSQRMAPIYDLFNALPETERDQVFSRAMVSTCMELEITIDEFPRHLADPVKIEAIADRLEDHSIYWVQSYLQSEADRQKINQKIDWYLKEVSVLAPFAPVSLHREAVRNAIYKAEKANSLEGVITDQLDPDLRKLFYHAITECLAAAQKKVEAEKEFLQKSESNAISDFSRSHLSPISQLLLGRSSEEQTKIVEEAIVYAASALGMRKEQFIESLNNSMRSADLAQSLCIEVELGARAHDYIQKEKQVEDRRIAAYLANPGEVGSSITTPEKADVRAVLEQAAILVQLEIPGAKLDGEQQTFFHDCISRLLKKRQQGDDLFPCEKYDNPVHTILPQMRKLAVFGKCQL